MKRTLEVAGGREREGGRGKSSNEQGRLTEVVVVVVGVDRQRSPHSMDDGKRYVISDQSEQWLALIGKPAGSGSGGVCQGHEKAKRLATGTAMSSNKLDRVRKKAVGLDKARDSPPEPALRSVL
jgi:hypothetical protein